MNWLCDWANHNLNEPQLLSSVEWSGQQNPLQKGNPEVPVREHMQTSWSVVPGPHKQKLFMQ